VRTGAGAEAACWKTGAGAGAATGAGAKLCTGAEAAGAGGT